ICLNSKNHRTYALCKLTMICLNNIWLFQAFGDEVYTNSHSEALWQAVRPKIKEKLRYKA
ncbi:hypothetical protein, partial [Sphaerospermopsis sp. LEGE 08334]|uniref:hypothetical protein n=1 Tax=Sphaerospermopsis sp. LEGE 08334 TaxID=1828651 RepID=UPI001D1577D2